MPSVGRRSGSKLVVGSGSRVPAVIKILTKFFGKEPRRTMNAKECVSKGCALECAKVKEFLVQESFPFPIALTWQGSSQESQNGNVENQQSAIVFAKGNQIPSVKALTFYGASTFTVDVQYADVSQLKAPANISTYTIGPFQTTNGEREKVKLKARLNLHGIVTVESALLIEDEKVKVPADVASANETNVNMRDASTAENGGQETGDNHVKMETDDKVEAPEKKVKKSNIPVKEVVYGGMSATDVQKAVEKEFEMALEDRLMEETKDKKNAVESYVYDMRNKVETTANPSSDPNSPYYIHPNDYPRQIHVNESLNDSNYAYWSREMKDFLLATNKAGFIDGTILQPAENSEDLKPWQRSNAMIKGWLTTAMEKEIRASVKYLNTAKEIWDDLEERFGKESVPQVFELKRELKMTRQQALSVSAYYTKMKGLWDEIEAVSPLPKCTCGKCKCDMGKRLADAKEKERVYEFLMGLEDVFSTVKMKILDIKPMPLLSSVYRLVAEDERQRAITADQ